MAQSNGFKSSIKLKLSWDNITVWLEERKTQNFWSFNTNKPYIKVLNNVSGVVYPGVLMAVMGASGSGKTTLLSTLSHKITGLIQGEICVNDETVTREQMKCISGFVPQQEFLLGDLTVEEHLKFMARMKMAKNSTSSERNNLILSIINRLSLNDSYKTIVSVLSGGEMKRLSIAIQLLSNPPVLFCDEPTTGLDSFTANSVITMLREVANSGKIVICSIHQSNSGIFDKFQQVMFLTGGNMMYNGPTEKLCSYLDALSLKCPVDYNPAEYFITQLGICGKDEEYIRGVCEYFRESDIFYELIYNNKYDLFSSNHFMSQNCFNQDGKGYQQYKKYKLNFFIQTYWLTWRCMTNNWRNSTVLLLRIISYMFAALLLSTLYWNLTKIMNQEIVQNFQGLIFVVITETYFTFAYTILHIFPEELPVLLREINSGTYDPGPYYLSKVISFIPPIFMKTFIYSLIIFWSIGFKGGLQNFLLFYIPIFFCAISSTAYGFALSTSFNSIDKSSLVAIVIDLITLSYSGFYVNISNLPWYLIWIPYVSQIHYTMEAISVSQWKEVNEIICDKPELPCFENGRMVLDKYGFQENSYGFDICGLLFIAIIFHLVGFLSFRHKCKKQPVY